MNLKRRSFLQLSTLAAGTTLVSGFRPNRSGYETFKISTADIAPISQNERKERISRAQSYMVQNKMEALILESGTSLKYFTGINWWPSERTMVAIVPSKGDPFYVCPAFEESRFRELIAPGSKVYAWQEDESPYQLIAHAFQENKIFSGKIGIEEEMRFFIFDGVRKAAPRMDYVSGNSVTIPCRMIKSDAELALMKKANDITVASMKAGIGGLKEGISQLAIADIINEAQAKMGATPDFSLVLFGMSSALPHGSTKSEKLKKGDIVLMDCVCTVEGYNSDITRTIVFGAEPTKRQQNVWSLEQRAQAAGFAAARIGNECEQVDAAARAVIVNAGFGPGYKLPGLPHRTGHGIGMDTHEWGNMVKGNQLKLQAGMCFSIEPTISIPGEFGVRLEDCVYMTDAGPKWFSQPAVSIDKPFG